MCTKRNSCITGDFGCLVRLVGKVFRFWAKATEMNFRKANAQAHTMHLVESFIHFSVGQYLFLFDQWLHECRSKESIVNLHDVVVCT